MTGENRRALQTSGNNALRRRESILDLLNERGFVSVVEIARLFGVSEMTARRDLQRLDETGLVKRTHGGAAWSTAGTGYDPSFQTRRQEQSRAKKAIGARAAELIAPGDVVGIDVGTTTLEVAEALINRRDLTIFTASVPTAMALLDADAEVYLLGGRLRKQELSLVGGLTTRALSGFHLDKAVIGAAGLSLEHGITDSSIEDTEVTRALIDRSTYRILTIDHTKFNRIALAAIAPLNEIDCIVTDEHPKPDVDEALARLEITVHVAAVEARPDGVPPGNRRNRVRTEGPSGDGNE